MDIMLVLLNSVTIVVISLYIFKTRNERGRFGLSDRLEAIEKAQERLSQNFRNELNVLRNDFNMMARQEREELVASLKNFQDSVLARMVEISGLQKNQLDTFSAQLANMIQANEQKLEIIRNAMEQSMLAARQDANLNAKNSRDEMGKSLKEFSESTQQKLESVRITVEEKLRFLQEDNSKKLEQMRATVDEKLHATLEQRLGDSFKIVSERLELVHKGLGEMQTLASGVGDLKKVLTNVKTRGIWGEIQLGNILEQILSTEQYLANVITKKGGNERVEYAIRLPGNGGTEPEVLMPIDAKFPQEDFLRIIEAAEQCNQEMVEEAGKQLENRIKLEARKIKEKYLDPPGTTDFGILFLPTESLYAEVVKRPNLVFSLQVDYRVIITGPTTMAALLNSLSVGFRTLAIEKRSSEVWVLLGTVKNEFGKFGDILDKTRKKLEEATNSIDAAARKTRTIERKLKNVQSLSEAELKAIDAPEIAASKE